MRFERLRLSACLLKRRNLIAVILRLGRIFPVAGGGISKGAFRQLESPLPLFRRPRGISTFIVHVIAATKFSVCVVRGLPLLQFDRRKLGLQAFQLLSHLASVIVLLPLLLTLLLLSLMLRLSAATLLLRPLRVIRERPLHVHASVSVAVAAALAPVAIALHTTEVAVPISWLRPRRPETASALSAPATAAALPAASSLPLLPLLARRSIWHLITLRRMMLAEQLSRCGDSEEHAGVPASPPTTAVPRGLSQPLRRAGAAERTAEQRLRRQGPSGGRASTNARWWVTA